MIYVGTECEEMYEFIIDDTCPVCGLKEEDKRSYLVASKSPKHHTTLTSEIYCSGCKGTIHIVFDLKPVIMEYVVNDKK